jgi:hypothetical protein
MEYLTQDELTRVMAVAKEQNELHWQAMLTALCFGPRVSEVTKILGEDGQSRVKRLKQTRSHSPTPSRN